MYGYVRVCLQMTFVFSVTVGGLFGGPASADTNEINSLSERTKEIAQAGNPSEAIPLAERAVKMARAEPEANSALLAVCLNRLAGHYRDAGRYAEAEPLFKRALAIREKALGPEAPVVALSRNHLAVLAVAQRCWARAADYWQRAKEMIEQRPRTQKVSGLWFMAGPQERWFESFGERRFAMPTQ
jgi:tetratricopeptide (TPR) repeat protein